MNQPVPVSRKAGGVTVCGPPPQFSVTSAETSEIMSTVAGLARSTSPRSTTIVSGPTPSAWRDASISGRRPEVAMP